MKMLEIPIDDELHKIIVQNAKKEQMKIRDYVLQLLLDGLKLNKKELTASEIEEIKQIKANNPQIKYSEIAKIYKTTWYQVWKVLNPDKFKKIVDNAKR